MESSSDSDSVSNSSSNGDSRWRLSEVVSDCVKRWFRDTPKEAKAGDINTQGRLLMTKASRTRPSVWKVSDKHPGYNASDSDSDELKGDS